MKIKIETGIPYAPGKVGRPRSNGLPFDQLEPGQSFFVPRSFKSYGAVEVATHRANQNVAGKKFKCSTIRPNQVTVDGQEQAVVFGTRVWRIE
jgi:hypothetical protein